MEVRVVPLADRPDLVDTVARWHWELWGSEDAAGSEAAWTERLKSWANRDAVPAAYVALADGRAVGSASLVAHDLPADRDLWDLWPWLSGVYVVPDARRRGVATALVDAVEAAAATLNAPWLYLYTATAQGLYQKLGWREIGTRLVGGRRVELMAKRLAPPGADLTEALWLSSLRPSRVREVQAGATEWTSAEVIDCGSGDEASAIRAVLEAMRIRVELIRVGQARHLQRALATSAAPWLIICGHGDDGRLVLPDLAPQVERFQPWRACVGAAEITATLSRRARGVILTGCGLGHDQMAAAFAECGTSFYLAPTGGPFLYASVMVVATLFYELVSGRDARGAVAKIASIDDELAMWRLWEGAATAEVVGP